jgi:hypothetical protein
LRRVESFASEDATDRSAAGSSLHLGQYSLFVRSGEAASEGAPEHFRVGRLVASVSSGDGPFGLASLALTPHRRY